MIYLNYLQVRIMFIIATLIFECAIVLIFNGYLIKFYYILVQEPV